MLSRIRIQLFTSMRIQIRIRIQGAKPTRIHADPDTDPGHTLSSWFRIPSTDTDPGEPNLCGFGSETLILTQNFYVEPNEYGYCWHVWLDLGLRKYAKLGWLAKVSDVYWVLFPSFLLVSRVWDISSGTGSRRSLSVGFCRLYAKDAGEITDPTTLSEALAASHLVNYTPFVIIVGTD